MLGALTFHPDPHEYRLNDRILPGVTEILTAEGCSGSDWYKEEHQQRGDAVHRITRLIDDRDWDPDTTTQALVPYGRCYEQFLRDSGFTPILSEQSVCSPTYGLAGTLDRWGDWPGKGATLVDFKSGRPEPAAHLQTALYAMMLEQWLGKRTLHRAVVWLRPEGPPQVFWGNGADLQAALAVVSVYHWKRNHKVEK